VLVYERAEGVRVEVGKLVEGKSGLVGTETGKYRCEYEVGLRLSVR
jgi:hypothetical protein